MIKNDKSYKKYSLFVTFCYRCRGMFIVTPETEEKIRKFALKRPEEKPVISAARSPKNWSLCRWSLSFARRSCSRGSCR